MKIVSRYFYEEYVDFYFEGWPDDRSLRLGFEASYIPSVGQDFIEIDNSVWAILIVCPLCQTEVERHVYALVNQVTGELKEIV